MALSDRVTTPPPLLQGIPCSIGTLLDTLQDAELDAFKQMLASKEWTASMVYDAVRDEGHTIGRQSISRHRGRKCRCFRVAS